MISDLVLLSEVRHNSAFVPLANKLKLALESCEPDIFKLLSAIHECLAYLDVLLGGNVAMVQTPDYDALILELDSIINNSRKGTLVTAGKVGADTKLKDAITQTDEIDLKSDINSLYHMMQIHRDETLRMIQDLSLIVRKYIPGKKSLDEVETEFKIIRESQINLSNYLEYLKYEIIKHRVRPGSDRICILMQERQSLNSKLARCKEDLLNSNYSSDRCPELWKMVEEQDLQDLKMKSLLDILNQVVALQENKDSIESWINRTKDETHYMKELEIRMKCYTSQERLDSLHEIESIRNYEKQIFCQNLFLRELKAKIETKSDLISSIQRLEMTLAEKYQSYISILWEQK